MTPTPGLRDDIEIDVVPLDHLIAVFIVLQRYWKLDLISGSLKG